MRHRVGPDDVVDAPEHDWINDFAALWRSKQTGDLLPGRADFDWAELQPWFGNIIMMDVLDGGIDFRYRLVGSLLVRAVGRDLTGRRISESDYDGARENVLRSFQAPIQTGAPVFRRGEVVWRPDRSWKKYESVHCPLASDGRAVDMTIGVQAYYVSDA